jgi:hypothetical protein
MPDASRIVHKGRGPGNVPYGVRTRVSLGKSDVPQTKLSNNSNTANRERVVRRWLARTSVDRYDPSGRVGSIKVNASPWAGSLFVHAHVRQSLVAAFGRFATESNIPLQLG